MNPGLGITLFALQDGVSEAPESREKSLFVSDDLVCQPPKTCQDPLSGASGDAATHECLGCICEASSKFCKVDMGCVAGGSLCGPFLISRGFWVDGGRCTEGGANGEFRYHYVL